MKLHTMIDLCGNTPCFIRVTHDKVHDVKALDHLSIEPGAYYVMNRMLPSASLPVSPEVILGNPGKMYSYDNP